MNRQALIIIVAMANILVIPALFLKVPLGSSYIHFTKVLNETSWVFFVKSCRNAKIGLFQNDSQSSVVYEVVLGAGRNTYSVLRSIINGNQLKFKRGPVLDCDKFLPFWIDWGNSGVAIGQGTFVGMNQMMVYSNPVQKIPVYLANATHANTANGLWILQLSCAKNRMI
ncbi:hypothetical protein SNE40_016081 [Patella caerulea]|uniref:Farnesoic acid O-methyl transferase domain-containing protein n=1 Tax=Patella caerulea TaxID=87958 RepID=A0AAN8JAA2_PATCE